MNLCNKKIKESSVLSVMYNALYACDNYTPKKLPVVIRIKMQPFFGKYEVTFKRPNPCV